jgi:hypothetical protein
VYRVHHGPLDGLAKRGTEAQLSRTDTSFDTPGSSIVTP